jgi:uncharacterized protein
MQISHYAKAYPYNNGSLVLYSLLSTAVVLVEEDVLDRMRNGTLSPDEQDELSGLGFLVNNPEEERNAVCSLMDRKNAAGTTLSLLSVMNLDCNLSCVYCFEGGMKGKLYMNGETADLLVDFISSRLHPEIKTVKIDFYGGEPLLSLSRIGDISRKVRALAEKKGIEYRFSLVTNGTLLTSKVVSELVLLGLEGARVTLDGPRENHNANRPFKTGKGTFDIIVKNIKDACGRIKIGIGGNFSRNNHHIFPELLDFLLDKGIKPDMVSTVKFDPVTPPANQPPAADFRDGCISIDEPWLAGASVQLREEILKRGFNTPDVAPALCAIHNDGFFVVNYDGSLYKCPGFIGREQFQIGSLSGGVSEYGASHSLDLWKNEQCMGCEYLPLCFGGCRYMKFLRDGDISGVDCKRSYFEATLESFVKQDIEYRLQG